MWLGNINNERRKTRDIRNDGYDTSKDRGPVTSCRFWACCGETLQGADWATWNLCKKLAVLPHPRTHCVVSRSLLIIQDAVDWSSES